MNRRTLVPVAGAILIVALAAGLGAYLYYFSGLRTAPRPLALPSPSPAASSSPAAADSLTGQWTAAPGSQAEYRQ